MNEETKNQEQQMAENGPAAAAPKAASVERNMSSAQAAGILARLANGWKLTEDEVTALEMGCRRLCGRWFQKQRRRARRAAANAERSATVTEVTDVAACLGEEVAS